MQNWKKLASTCAALAVFSFGVASHAGVTEPVNNNHALATPAWAGTMAIFAGGTGTGFGNDSEEISSSDDNDWWLMTVDKTCASGRLWRVRITPNASSNPNADLDVRVYDLRGNQIGMSQNSGINEYVDVSAQNTATVILRVYSWSGTSSYHLGMDCF